MRTNNLTRVKPSLADDYTGTGDADKPAEAPENTLQARLMDLWRSQDGRYIPDVPVYLVARWPKQPREDFNEAALQELTDSVREHGVQQAIVVRPARREDYCVQKCIEGEGYLLQDRRMFGFRDRNGMFFAFAANEDAVRFFSQDEAILAVPAFEIVMGERRWRASLKAQCATIPVVVRTRLDDLTALRLAVTENTQRESMNPVEEAKAFAALEKEGDKQTEIAATIGKSAAYVGNRKRLLALPADVLDMIAKAELSPAQALPLIRYADFPAAVSHMAVIASMKRIAAHDLERGLSHEMTYPLAEKMLIKDLSHVSFDKAVCKKCPFKARFVHANGWNEYCFWPEHAAQLAEEKNAEDKRRFEDEKKKALESAQRNTPLSEKAHAKLVAAGQIQEGETVAGVVRLDKLRYDGYVNLAHCTLPAGCTEQCPCRAKGMSGTGSHASISPICLDPGRHRGLKAQETKAKKKILNERFQKEAKRARRLCNEGEAGFVLRSFAYNAYAIIDRMSDKETETVIDQLLPEEGDLRHVFDRQISWQKRNESRAEFLAAIERHGPERVFALIGLAQLVSEHKQVLEYPDKTPEISGYLLHCEMAAAVNETCEDQFADE